MYSLLSEVGECGYYFFFVLSVAGILLNFLIDSLRNLLLNKLVYLVKRLCLAMRLCPFFWLLYKKNPCYRPPDQTFSFLVCLSVHHRQPASNFCSCNQCFIFISVQTDVNGENLQCKHQNVRKTSSQLPPFFQRVCQSVVCFKHLNMMYISAELQPKEIFIVNMLRGEYIKKCFHLYFKSRIGEHFPSLSFIFLTEGRL